MTDRRYAARVTMFRGAFERAVEQARRDGSLVLCVRSLRELVHRHAPDARVTVPESISLSTVDRLTAESNRDGVRSVLAIGGGRVIDVAKALSARRGVPLTVVPSVLSCNSFATGKAILRSARGHQTIDAKPATEVLVDPALLDRLDYRLNALGIADALSIRTALVDWQVAAAAGVEPVDPMVFDLSRVLGEYVYDRATSWTVAAGPDAADGRYAEILRVLELSGWITTLYGSGRPESGAEHCVSRVVEQRTWNCRIWHGESVLLGMLVAAELQGQDCRGLYRIARAFDLPRRLGELGVRRHHIAELVLEARNIRADRFTILNSAELDERAADLLAGRVLGTLCDGAGGVDGDGDGGVDGGDGSGGDGAG